MNKEDRFKKVKKASMLGIIGNIFLAIIKGIVGFMTGSQAMIADFFNSAGDVFSSLMTLIGNRIASKPNDEDHDLGHGKAEYIFSMLISIAIMYTSIMVIKSSVETLINNEQYEFSIWLIVVALISLAVKFTLFLYTNYIGKQMNNILIEANSKDHRNDSIIILLNIFSIILNSFGIHYVDGIVGIIISVWILYQGASIFRESFDILMDKSMDENTKKEVIDIVKSIPEIKKFQHFNSTPVGYQYQVSLTIFVDGNLSTFESHKIADELEEKIVKNINEVYLAIIHVNPI